MIDQRPISRRAPTILLTNEGTHTKHYNTGNTYIQPRTLLSY